MKKTVLSTFLVFFAISLVSAQHQDFRKDHENFFRIGAKGGVNINKIQGQSYKQGFRYNFQVGAFTQFNFSDVFGLQPEVNFVQSRSEFTNDATSVYDDLFYGDTQGKATLNYLEIPVLLNINVGPSKRVKLQFGPSYGALLKAKVDSLQTNQSIYKDNEWSAMGGLWLQLPLINMGARYKLGLTNLNAIDDRQTWKNQAIQIFVGITL